MCLLGWRCSNDEQMINQMFGWALASEHGDYGLQTRKLTAETWKWSLKEREIQLYIYIYIYLYNLQNTNFWGSMLIIGGAALPNGNPSSFKFQLYNNLSGPALQDVVNVRESCWKKDGLHLCWCIMPVTHHQPESNILKFPFKKILGSHRHPCASLLIFGWKYYVFKMLIPEESTSLIFCWVFIAL